MEIESIIKKKCLICMEEHEVHKVSITETEEFKGEVVEFVAAYEYCPNADEFMETEEMARKNSLAMKDAYRRKKGLLTSQEIIGIREKLSVSQKDFSEILDWGRATVIRYENHQVQDRAHDDILRKIDSDPLWYISMLERAKFRLPKKAYSKYHKAASSQLEKQKSKYLENSIYAIYSSIHERVAEYRTDLNLDKVVEIINYLALKIRSLDEMKLSLLLYLIDVSSRKKAGIPITGLIYDSRPDIVLPEGISQIIQLDGVTFKIEFNSLNCFVREFIPVENFETKILTLAEIAIIDEVMIELGMLSTGEILSRLSAPE